MKRLVVIALILSVIAPLAGATPPLLSNTQSIAWSLRSSRDEMIIAVSPARRTLQIAGTSGAVVGAGVDAVVNARYRDAVREALGDYDAGQVFAETLATRLEEALDAAAQQVSPPDLNTTSTERLEMERARFDSLRDEGHERVLDLEMTYGLFGADGILIAKLSGELLTLPEGLKRRKKLWDDAIVVSARPILANDTLSDPTKRLGPNWSSPRLTAEKDAIDKWTDDDAAHLKQQFEQAVNGVVSALLCEMGVAEEALGEYYLGRQLLYQKKFKKAQHHIEAALGLDPAMLPARNALAVLHARRGAVSDAIAAATELAEEAPEYGPAAFNLAWWYAVENRQPEQARLWYEKALELGMPASEKIEKALD